MAMKSIILITLLVVVLVAPQKAQAQLPLPPLPQLPILPPLVRIAGTVFCSLNGTNVVNPPPFANATVQLRCAGAVIQTTLTNNQGNFTIVIPQLQILLSNLLSPNCTIVVASPLSTCNAALSATGLLQAPLLLVRTVVLGGIQAVTELILGAFRLVSV